MSYTLFVGLIVLVTASMCRSYLFPWQVIGTRYPCLPSHRNCINSVIEATDTNQKALYHVFRKRFHVPKRWADDEAFKELAEHRYEKEQHTTAFDFIERRLMKLNYHADNKQMVHDYLHYLICDMLDVVGVPYITKEDLKSAHALKDMLDRKAPDLILEPAKPNLPMAIDVYVGDRTQSTNDKREKYRGLGMFLSFKVVTIANIRALANVLPAEDLRYIQDQVSVFLAEYQYWHACLKLKKILFNDIEHIPIRTLGTAFDNTIGKVKLITRLEKMSQIFAAYKNGDDDL